MQMTQTHPMLDYFIIGVPEEEIEKEVEKKEIEKNLKLDVFF